MNMCTQPARLPMEVDDSHQHGCALRYGAISAIIVDGVAASCSCKTTETKNPKLTRALKDGKVPMEYLVYSVLADDARCHKGGGDKYGIRNWLKNRITASTYEGAMLRHFFAWASGEDLDPESGLSHLTHLRACCAVVLDAEVHGTLIDDRKRVESKNQTEGKQT